MAPQKSDRIRIRDRLDQRMASNPARRQMKPTDWSIKGELFMNCSCTVFCPCVVSLGKHPPTEGHCHAWMAIAIDEGEFEGESLSGIITVFSRSCRVRQAAPLGCSLSWSQPFWAQSVPRCRSLAMATAAVCTSANLSRARLRCCKAHRPIIR